MSNKKRNEGMILPTVLIIFSVLMLLGVGFLSISANQEVQSVSQVNRLQAEYLARSGAESFAQFIIEEVTTLNKEKKVDEAEEYLKSLIEHDGLILPLKIGSQTNETIMIKIDVKPSEDETNLFISSEVVYKEIKEEALVTLKLNKTTSESLVLVPVTGKSVVLIDNDFKNGVNKEGNKKEIITTDDVIGMDSVNFPEMIPNPNETVIEVNDNEIDITGNPRSDVIYVAENLSINDDFNLIKRNDQRLILYVTSELQISNDKNVDVEGVLEDYNDLVIIMTKEANIKVGEKNDNKVSFKGILYAPHIELVFNNNARIDGVIVVSRFIVKNNVNVEAMIVAHYIEYRNNLQLITIDQSIEIPSQETVADKDISIEFESWN